MTKVQMRFRLLREIDDTLMTRIADAHALYGLTRVKLDPALDGLTVDYDASRLKPDEVEGALRAAGLPIERVAV